MGETPPGDGGTVGKALAVLDLVASFERPVRFGELLPLSPFPKASLYRFLQTLTGQGMLSYDDAQQTYAPGPRLLRLAHAAWRGFSLAPLAAEELDALAAEVGETIHLAQLDHAHVLYIDKRSPANAVRMYSSAGKVGPAYCTGVGKAMLAWLDGPALDAVIAQQSFHRFTPATLTDGDALRADLAESRRRGFAVDREEHEPGIVCVALPILGGRQPIGALSVTAATTQRTLDDLMALVPRVRRAADAISEAARYWQFPDRPREAAGGAKG